MEHIFQRKIYQEMLSWKQDMAGQYALLIEGARRIGKSTIVRQFVQHEYKSYIFIDFAIASKKVLQLFDDISDLDNLFLMLQAEYSTTLHPRESVIVFDEVQFCPRARQAIKHLVADGRYDYIETGSLISIRKNIKNILIPSEEHRIEMFPMDYEEFQWALGNQTFQILNQFLIKNQALGNGLVRKKMRDLRLYMLVGGMPQAISKYLDTKDLQQVDSVKREIINLYMDDFRKIDNSGNLSRLFESIPAQLSKNVSRYYPSPVIGNLTQESILTYIRELEDSKTINIAYHTNDPNVGMSLTADSSKYKLYVGDTGLFVTLAFWDKKYIDNELYAKLLNDKLSANLGYVYENLVAQMLRASGNRLFYYTFPKDENHNYEIDFLLSRGSKVCPIEVKSSGYKTHASLDAFCKKFSSRIRNRYLIYTKDLYQDQEMTYLPVFMTPFI